MNKVTSKSSYLISCRNNLENGGHSAVFQVAYGSKFFVLKVDKLSLAY